MPIAFEVTQKDIKSLDDRQLVLLLEMLLENELRNREIPLNQMYVSLDVNTADGGEDGLVNWSASLGIARTDFIPRPRTLFQSKAGEMRRKKFVGELFKTDKTIKERVKATFDDDGAYVMFYGKSCLGGKKSDRIKDMRSALEASYPGRALTIDIYDCSDIKRWTNHFPAAASRVLEWLGKTAGQPFRTWTHWSGDEGNRGQYFPSTQSDELMGIIKGELTDPKRVVRIVGKSGLGKTRLAFESFRPPADLKTDSRQGVLSGSAIFVDFEDVKNTIVSDVRNIMDRGASAIVIVDNCPESDHSRLVEVVRHSSSKLSLLTLDYHVDDVAPGIHVLGHSPDEIIAGMIRETHPTLGDIGVAAVVKYANGFPKIPALLRDVSLEDGKGLGPLSDNDLTKRLVWGRNEEDTDGLTVIEACSIFMRLGYDGQVVKEREYVATHVCSMSPTDFYRHAQKFTSRILDRFGDFVRVSPPPLKMRLTEGWFAHNPPEIMARMLADPEMPQNLQASLAQRYSGLGEDEQAKEMTRQILTSDPFRQAEVLNSTQGSRIFRYLTEVNPAVALQTLIAAFGNWTTDELREVGPGRRSIMWALSVIVFNRDLFVQGAQFMAQLALAENEDISNNAKGEFLHLFQPTLAGTEAGPALRLHVIDWCLASSDQDLRTLGIMALGRVLSHGHSRVLGAEDQGGRTLKDWFPATYGEYFAYLDAAVGRLAEIGLQDDALGALARRNLAGGIRLLVRNQRFDATEAALRRITAAYEKAWPEAISTIREALRFELKESQEDWIQRVSSWLDILDPQSEDERIRLIVSEPEVGQFEVQGDGSYVDVAAEQAADLGRQYANRLDEWTHVASILSGGLQRQAFAFGQAFGEIVKPDGAHSVIRVAIDAFKTAATSQNPSLLGGLLFGLRFSATAVVNEAVQQILNEPELAKQADYFVAVVGLTLERLTVVIDLVEAGTIAPAAMRRFGHGRILADFEPTAVRDLLLRILPLGSEAVFAALFVGYMYAKGNEEKWATCRPLFRAILETPGVFEAKHPETFDQHALEQAAVDLLDDADSDESILATFLAGEIVRIVSLHDLTFQAYETLTPILFSLLGGKYSAIAWPIVRKAFDSDELTRWHMLHLAKHSVPKIDQPESALLCLPADLLEQWCEDMPALAPAVVIRSVPLFEYDGAQVRITPLARRIIETYGDQKRVLSEASANLNTFGNVGSLVPAYEKRLAFVKQFSTSSRKEVREWASLQAADYESIIASQRKRDEEHEQGIWEFGGDDS